jgi:hypothetical protein
MHPEYMPETSRAVIDACSHAELETRLVKIVAKWRARGYTVEYVDCEGVGGMCGLSLIVVHIRVVVCRYKGSVQALSRLNSMKPDKRPIHITFQRPQRKQRSI